MVKVIEILSARTVAIDVGENHSIIKGMLFMIMPFTALVSVTEVFPNKSIAKSVSWWGSGLFQEKEYVEVGDKCINIMELIENNK